MKPRAIDRIVDSTRFPSKPVDYSPIPFPSSSIAASSFSLVKQGQTHCSFQHIKPQTHLQNSDLTRDRGDERAIKTRNPRDKMF